MEKLCYSDEELQGFKAIIEKKMRQARQELSETLGSLADTNRNIASDKMLSTNDSLVVEEQENLNALAIRLQKFIQHLEAALERIVNKTYGICHKTHKLIDKQRLLLVPHATLSVEAKNQRS